MLQPLLTRLDELEKSATKGPWPRNEFGCGEGGTFEEEDADLICALRNAYPLIRAEIERLQEVERKYEEMKSKNHT